MIDKYRIGTKHITNEGYEVEIVEKLENDRRKVKFESGYESVVHRHTITQGAIKNPYHPSVYGAGYIGVGDYKSMANNKITPEYNVWTSMLQRVYSNKFQEKRLTYKGATICEEWLNFQNFAKWYDENYPRTLGEKFHLDKDLLQDGFKNKIYSPSTCVFLPQSANGFLTNKQSNNTSGYIGVSWGKDVEKWVAKISLFGEDRKQKNLGHFPTPEEASIAYQQARFEQAEKVKDYIRSLNYLSEDTIKLIK